MVIRYHMIAFMCGYLLDMLVGDPYWLYHPVRLIGLLIGALEKRWNRTDFGNEKKRKLGYVMVCMVLGSTILVVTLALFVAYRVSWKLGILVEGIMTYQILATKCLRDESMKVYQALRDEDLMQARKAVSMIVGRDTANLTEEGVAKAAIETVAENTSDGVIAPMLYLAMGGPILAWGYKAINTMDSMVGYKDEKYLFFGSAAAKIDDMVNYLPARISGLLMIVVSFFLGMKNKRYSGKGAWKIFIRDRYNHASPNSAQTEAACAGSLGLRLAGDASYFGKIVRKPYIGDEIRKVEYEDIKRANILLYGTSIFCMMICVAIMFLLTRGIG